MITICEKCNRGVRVRDGEAVCDDCKIKDLTAEILIHKTLNQTLIDQLNEANTEIDRLKTEAKKHTERMDVILSEIQDKISNRKTMTTSEIMSAVYGNKKSV